MRDFLEEITGNGNAATFLSGFTGILNVMIIITRKFLSTLKVFLSFSEVPMTILKLQGEGVDAVGVVGMVVAMASVVGEEVDGDVVEGGGNGVEIAIVRTIDDGGSDVKESGGIPAKFIVRIPGPVAADAIDAAAVGPGAAEARSSKTDMFPTKHGPIPCGVFDVPSAEDDDVSKEIGSNHS